MDKRLSPRHLRLMRAYAEERFLRVLLNSWSAEFRDLVQWGHVLDGKLTNAGKSALRAAGWAP